METPKYGLNTQTNRMIKSGTRNFNRLNKLGLLQFPTGDHQIPPTKEPELAIETTELEPEKTEEVVVEEQNIKPVLEKELKSIIKENKNEFKNLTQKESDELLKRMLYQKLVLNVPKKQKEKKKKTTKFKLKKIVVSDSDTDSESESD